MIKTIKNRVQNTKSMIGFIGLSFISTEVLADELPALNNAARWVTSTLISIALAVLGLQIMFRLGQVNQGQKEWSEVAKPILVTAAIVAVPAVITALASTMR